MELFAWNSVNLRDRPLLFILISISIAAVILLTPRPTAADKLGKMIDAVAKRNRAAARSQARVDKMADRSESLLREYRSVNKQIESLRVYNAQVQKLVAAQRAQIAGLERRIENAAMVGREVTPLMLRMIDALETFIKLDVPFLQEERTKRVARLRKMMDRSEVPDSEKYRRIMEAFQVENEYGRTIEAYKSKLALGGRKRTVNFLRVGRVVLVYQTLDGKEAGVWDQERRSWQPLSGEHRTSLRRGFRIARKQMAPDLIRLPVPAAKDVGGRDR
jgi:hypothetical protein